MFGFQGILGPGGYPVRVGEAEGLRNYPKFVHPINDTLTQFLTNRAHKLGGLVADGDGNIFQWVRAGEALSAGNIVIPQAPVVGALVTADSTGDNIHVFRTNITAQTGVDSEVGNLLVVDDAATSKTHVFKILGNTSGANSYITVSKKDTRFGRGGYDSNTNKVASVETAGANAVVATLIRPYHVIKCTAVEQNAVGVVMGNHDAGAYAGTVDSGNVTLVMVHGQTEILAVGSTDAVVAGEPICTTATSGTGAGCTAAGTTALNLSGMVGRGIQAHAGAALPIFAQVTVFGKW